MATTQEKKASHKKQINELESFIIEQIEYERKGEPRYGLIEMLPQAAQKLVDLIELNYPY